MRFLSAPPCRLLCGILLTALLWTAGWGRLPLTALSPYPMGEEMSALPLTDLPQTGAGAAVLMEAESGQILYGQQENLRLPMASTTKIVTAMVVLRLCRLEDTVTVSSEAAGIEGSSMYLESGERLTVEDLLYGLLLASANDAAVALAMYAAGNIETFVAWMNAEAGRLGLVDTHFVTVNGLDDPDHYTTAKDLALLTAEALKNETFRKIVATENRVVVNQSGRRYFLSNHNRLLREYQGCIGVKTGYTMRSGRCLVSAAEREGMTLIAVTLSDRQDWKDHKNLLDFGFANYERKILAEPEDLRFETPKGDLAARRSATALLRRGALVAVSLRVCLYEEILFDGEGGYACFTAEDGTVLSHIPLYLIAP